MSLPTKVTNRRTRNNRVLVLFVLGLLIAVVGSSVLVSRIARASAFTPGNLVIYRVGDGSAALASSATAVFLDEYPTAGGSAVQSIAMPTVVNASNKRFTASGTATSEGLMTLSVDGKYLTAAGYDAALATATITTSTSATVNRVIARVDSSGAVDTTTALTDAISGGNPRGAVSTNGTDLWISGTSSGGGIRYAALGATTSTALNTATVTNLRATNIYGGQLYASSQSGAFRLATIGTGTPTTAGQTITNLPGFPTATGSPYNFFFADLDGVAGIDTVYVADDGGTIQKYSLVAGSWTTNGTKALSGVRGLTGVVSGTNVTLYVTSGTTLATVTDTSGYNATINGTVTTLATAPTNTAFRGVAFAPVGGASPSPSPSPSPSVSPSPTPTPTPSLSINDVSQVEGNTGTSSFTFTVSLSLPAPAGGVTFNVDTADGSATLADNDYVAVHGTGATIDAGLTSTTITVPVNGDTTPEANETFFVNISSVTGAGVTKGSGTGTIVNDDGVGSSLVVISQVYGGGGNSGATYKNDFIELYNRGASPVDLTGWSVQYAGAANTFGATSPIDGSPLVTNLPSFILQPGHYFLIQEAAGAGGTTNLPTPDVTGAIALGSGSGKVALVSNTTVLSVNCPAFAPNGIVDFVGYGTADCSETSPTAVLSNTTAAIRNQNGCMDIDYNAQDFSVGGPTPRNSSNTNTCAGSGALSASGNANPNSIEPGGSTLLAVSVSPAAGPTSTGITVTGDLSTIGGSPTQQFYDDGTHGDVTIGDHVFSYFATTAANTTTGAKTLPVSVSDAQARTASASISMSVVSPTCGVERWSVKVGTDPDSPLVDLTKATPVTVATMRGWPAPSSPPLNARVGPYETTAWIIQGTLIDYKQESDVDYHIVVQDGSGNTVITEIPCPCCGIGSPFQTRMAGARSTFDSRLTASTFFQNPNIPVRITGVGFFDFLHGQTGVAPNGIELHSILDIAFPTQQTAATGAGANVTTTAGDAKIKFGNVTVPGNTTVNPIDPSTAGPALANYSLVGPAFNITTTATSTGPYNVCISVPYITDPIAFAKLKLLHNEGGTLVDRTTGQDNVNKLICGNSPSLSPFVVAIGPTPSATDGSVTGRITDNAGNPVAGAAIHLDGTQTRLTITDAAGNYHFDNVETNGFYTITPTRANYAFAPATRSFSALGFHIDAVFNAEDLGTRLNPLDTTEYFVRQQYLDFLGREPEEAGLTGWVNTINNCAAGNTSCDRVHVSESFFRSAEFQQRGYFLYRFYAVALGRKPDYTEFAPDLKRVSGYLDSGQLEGAKNSFVDDFMARPQFEAQYNSLSNAAYVDALLNTAQVNLASRQALIDALNAGTQTRGAVLRQIAESGEVYSQNYNTAFVVMEYFGYLQRDPDALYLNWIVTLDANPADSRRMVDGFVNAPEYRARFAK